MRGHFCALFMLLTSCVASSSSDALNGTISEVQIMTSNQEQAASILRLPDADYFSFDEDRHVKLQSELAKLVDSEDPKATSGLFEPILVIGAPGKVDVDERGSFPVLVGHIQSGLRAWQVNYESNLQLFVRNISTGELSVAQPLIDMRRGEQPALSGAGGRPDKANAGIVYASISPINLLKRLEVPVTSGQILVTAVVNELRSNSVSLNVRSKVSPSPPLASPQPYVQYQLERQAEFPTLVKLPSSASAKAAIPIKVAIQVSGIFDLTKTPSGQALWNFHIALIKLDERPVIIPVTVLVQEASSTSEAHVFNASFEVNVAAATKSKLSGRYQVYIDVGREFLGPYPLSVSE